MNRRSFVLCGSLALPTAALAACAPGGAEHAPGPGSAGPVTVKLGVRGTADIKPLFDAASADFMQRQSRVKVELWVNEPDYYTMLPVAFTGAARRARRRTAQAA